MEKKKPVNKIRIGKVSAAIWANESEQGVFHNVSFERTYFENEEARSSNSFGRDDLLVLAKVADRAHDWILEQSTK